MRDSAMASEYDAFISYSHAADGLLAPRLQSGLQRFAKPWWKRRAVRVFRDESSLSANPHLWSSITRALDQSEWFVLLLSPEAAESQWVKQEIEYWRERRDPSRILPVVTDGDFGWDGSDVTGSAVPEALLGAFSEEPRWVDLRFARSEEQLDLKNPRFVNAIADVAAPVRGVPKDELESEEVRQHRRAMRTAWVAGVGLATLLVAASVFGLIAMREGQRANQAASDAARERDRASELAEQEEAARLAAEEAAATAEREAANSRAGALASGSVAQADIDPELALLLALEAVRVSPVDSAVSALHSALVGHRVIGRFPFVGPAPRHVTAGLSPDGRRVVVSSDGVTQMFEVGSASENPVWTHVIDETANLFSWTAVFFSDDGKSVFVSIADASALEKASADTYSGLHELDATTGTAIRHHRWGACTGPGFPAFGRLVRPGDPLIGFRNEVEDGACGDFAEVGVVDRETGAFEVMDTRIISNTGVPTMSGDLRRFASFGFDLSVHVKDARTGETIRSFEGVISTLSADGSRILVGSSSAGSVELRDVDSGELIARYHGSFSRAYFSADETMVYATSYEGPVEVFDALTGRQLHRFRAAKTRPVEATMLENGLLLTDSEDSGLLFDLNFQGELGRIAVASPAHKAVEGSLQIEDNLMVVSHWLDSGPDLTSVVDLESGHPVLQFDSNGAAAVAPGGQWVVGQRRFGSDDSDVWATLSAPVVLDVESGETVATLGDCGAVIDSELRPLPTDGCDEPVMLHRYRFSDDGALLLGIGDPGTMVWEVGQWNLLWSSESPDSGYSVADFTASGERVVTTTSPEVRDAAGVVVMIHDAWSGEVISRIENPAGFTDVGELPNGSIVAVDDLANLVVFGGESFEAEVTLSGAQGGALVDLAIDSVGSAVATVGYDGIVRVWDLDERSIMLEVDLDADVSGRLMGVEFLDDETLIVVPTHGDALLLTLNTQRLVEIAAKRSQRSFTAVECTTWGIDDCPSTREDLRKRYVGAGS